MKTQLRTHTCGQLTEKDVDIKVKMCGWVNTLRTHGGITFVDIRDRYGITQTVFDPKHKNIDSIKNIGREDVIQITGTVRKRPDINPKIPTGKIEVLVDEIEMQESN